MRKPANWMAINLAVLALHIIALKFGNEALTQITKPLLVPTLIVAFLLATPHIKGAYKNLTIAGLYFSWLGDILLMFQSKDSMFFILGLSSFLIAHLFYITLFIRLKNDNKLSTNFLFFGIALLLCFGLLGFLQPHLGEMQIPVIVYGIVICTMLAFALHAIQFVKKESGKLIAIGAGLFVVSDSLLAINKFYSSFGLAAVLIMITYGLAQFFIMKGVKDYLIKMK